MINLFINTSTNIFCGFTSQNPKGGNVACWMCIMCHVWLNGKRTEVCRSLTPLSLIKRHDEGGALLNTLLREVHEMWTLENGQTLTTDERAISTFSFFRKSVLLTLQCPFLERKSCHGKRAALRTRLDYWWRAAKLRSGWKTSRTRESSAVERWNADAIHCNKGK